MAGPKSDKAQAAQVKKFIAHYVVHFNGAAAYRFAGFECADGSASELARRLLSRVEVQTQIDAEIKKLGDLHFRLHEENTARLVSMRDADRSLIFTPQGEVKDIDEWPEELKAMIAGIEVEELWQGQGEDRVQIGVLKKVKFDSPRSIIDSLAKISGQWVDRSQYLDKFGRPTDPPSSSIQPIINVTVGVEPKK